MKLGSAHSHSQAPSLVHLHGAVDLKHEPPGGDKADGSGGDSEEERADEHVGKVEHRRDEAHDLERRRKVDERVAWKKEETMKL